MRGLRALADRLARFHAGGDSVPGADQSFHDAFEQIPASRRDSARRNS